MVLFKKNLTEKEIKKEISISIIISYITIGVGVLVNFFYTPFLLKNIGTNQYGIHTFATSIISWLSIITTALCSGYLKFASEEAKKDGSSVSRLNGIYFWFFLIVDAFVLLIGCALAILIKTGVIPLNNFSTNEITLLVPCILLMTINMALSIFVSFFSLFEAYKERFIWARLITLLQTLFNPVFSIIFILLGGNVVVVCIVQAALTLINLVLLSFHAVGISGMKIKLKIRDNTSKLLISNAITFSIFALISTIATSINQSADKILLGFVSGPTDVAVYQLGMSLVLYLSLFCSSFTNSLSTRLYKVDLESKEQANKMFLKISHLQTLVVCFIVGGFIICGKPFMNLWAGKENVNAYFIGVILFVINIFAFSNMASEVLVKSRGYFKFEAIYYVIEAVCNVLLSLLFVFLFGKENALFTCAGATFIIIFLFRWVGLTIFYKKKINLPMGEYYLKFLKFALITFGCIAITFGISKLFTINSDLIQLLVKGVIFSLLYPAFTLVIDKESLTIVKHFIRKNK